MGHENVLRLLTSLRRQPKDMLADTSTLASGRKLPPERCAAARKQMSYAGVISRGASGSGALLVKILAHLRVLSSLLSFCITLAFQSALT